MGLFSKRIEKQIESYQHELIETHYREVDNMYRQIRGWRHDYRNHIQTMKAYAATENWEAIKNYLDLLDEDLTTVDTVSRQVIPDGCDSELKNLFGKVQGYCGGCGCPYSRQAEIL